jgi:ATP-binding cassette subfamily C protein
MTNTTAAELFSFFSRSYPSKTIIMLVGLVTAGLMEALGILSLLPIIGLAGKDQAQVTPAEQIVVDALSIVNVTPTVGILLSLITLGMFLKAVITLFAMKQVGYTVAHVATELRRRLIKALMNARWSFFYTKSVGEVSNTISTEITRAAQGYESACMVIALIIQSIVYLIIAVFISWKVTFFALLGGLIIFYILNNLIKGARKIGREQSESMNSMLIKISDGISGLKPLKAMAKEKQLQAVLEKNAENLNDALKRSVINRQTLNTMQEPLMVLFLASGMYVAYAVFDISITNQLIMAFLFFRLITRFGNIQQNYQTIMLSEAAYTNVVSTILDAEHEQEIHNGIIDFNPKKDISFNNVSFSYGNKKILRNMSCTVKANSLTTFIGESGVGKSTLVDLVIGLNSPEAGTILIGDYSISELEQEHWRKKIGYVPQEVIMFNDTIRNNVTLGDETISDKAVVNALIKADIWKTVNEYPDGLNYNVGERGQMISGGQRQRIAIARALVNNPDILILDEATSALDPETEKTICQTIKKLKNGVTIISITHQPVWGIYSDAVYRIHNGKVIPEG